VKRVVIWLLLFVVVFVGAFAAWVAFGVVQPYKGYAGDEQFVDIPQGEGPGAIGRRLADAGVVRDLLTFRIEVLRSGEGRRLRAGEYRFDRPMTPKDVVAKLARGDVYLLPITFREGLTIQEMAALYESKGFGPAAEFIAAASDAQLVRTLDPAAKNLEGYLFPDTYNMPRHSSAGQLVARMVSTFEKELTPELRAKAEGHGLSVRELVTLASIVEKETGKAEERPMVAAVYANRLRIGMGLQCDPTVIYALQRVHRYNGNLTREDLQFDSPYNTYRYRGLPPGPIASAGRASLEAAADPADVPYVYFVSRGDGTHVFATTLEEHNRNVYEFQKKPFMRLP
jgi:UPF0755 protein